MCYYCTFKKQDCSIRQRSNRVQKDSVTWNKNFTTYKPVVCAGKTLRHVSGSSRIENSKTRSDVVLFAVLHCVFAYACLRANVTHKVSRGEGGLIRKTACLSHRSEPVLSNEDTAFGNENTFWQEIWQVIWCPTRNDRMPCSKRCALPVRTRIRAHQIFFSFSKFTTQSLVSSCS